MKQKRMNKKANPMFGYEIKPLEKKKEKNRIYLRGMIINFLGWGVNKFEIFHGQLFSLRDWIFRK